MPALKNEQHERFCQEYTIDLCQTAAYMRVFGGSNYNAAATCASRLFKRVEVAARVKELLEEINGKTELNAEWVVLNLKKVLARCMQAEPVKEWDYQEKCFVETGQFTFDSKGANQALVSLGKHLGMYTDKVIQSDAGLADQLQQARARLAKVDKERGGADGGRTAGSNDRPAGREGTT